MTASLLSELMTGGETPASKLVRMLAGFGAATPQEIAQDTGLARSTISTVLSDLRATGLIVDGEMIANGLGRPSQSVSLAPRSGCCAGVLLGFEEVRVAICDVAHAILSETSVPVHRDYTPEEAAFSIRQSLEQQCTNAAIPIDELLGVGLAVSAPVSPDGTVLSGSILPTWDGVNIASVFGPILQLPIHADNESNCGALAEMMWGAAQGETNFILFKCSLGIGGAAVVDGRLITGADGFAGEFGHITLQPDGALCRCGKRGCVESIAGGAKLVRLASEISDKSVTLPDLVSSAVAGHPGHVRLIEDAADTLGWTLGILSTTINPALYVITGEMAAAGDIFLSRLCKSHDRHSLHRTNGPDGRESPRFVTGTFVGNDTVLGAAALVLRQLSRL